MIHKGISPQYLKKERINVTILDIIDPAHFVIKECPDLSNESSVATSFLEAEAAMQQYYDSVDPGFIQLPLKDTIIVVLYEGKFYRARVVRILTKSAGHLFKVYLVDYGIECTVSQENIYKIEKDFDFVEHPFQAVTIELLGIKPISLVMDETSITVSYGPVSSWDPSTLIYLKELTKSMCSAYIEVQGADDSQLYGKLFFCFESSPTKCINDDLITKSFACFNEDCWKNIKTIESILDDGNENIETPNSQSTTCKNENSGKVPLIDNLTKVESDDIDFTVKFINPVDGKVLAESTLSRNTSDTADAMLENESVSLEETKPHLHKSEIKSPSSTEEKSSKTEVQQIARKTLMKLQQLKRKSISPCKDSVIGDTVKTMTEKSISIDTCTVESRISNDRLSDTTPNTNCQSQTPSEDVKETCKNNQENCWNKSLSQQIANKRFTKLQQQLLKKKSISPHKSCDIDCCGGLEKTTVADSNTSNLTSEKIPHNGLNHSLSNEVIQSETPKETIDETAKSSQKQENVSLNQLIAQKRFMKLQQLKLNRKSLSPHKSSDSDHSEEQSGLAKATVSAVNLSIERIPPVSLNETLPNKMVQSKTPNKTTVEAAKNIQEQENVNLVFLENKKLENLQQKIRINKKEPMIITSNEETNTFQKDDDLLCDSDSGYNAYSSSSSTSDKIE